MKKTIQWMVVATLFSVIATPSFAQSFGGTLAVAGNDVIVGETGNSAFPGSVYVFNKLSGKWSEAYQIVAPGGSERGDTFGRALASNGDHLIIGAPGQNKAYVFARNSTGQWGSGVPLAPDDAAEGDLFGSTVSIEGGIAVVGATDKSEKAGAAYVFRLTNGSWKQEAKLSPEELKAGALFGSAIVTDGNVIIIGAPARAGGGGGRGPQQPTFTEVGSAYAFRFENGTWARAGQLGPQGVFEGAGFGSSLSLDGSSVAVGAPFDAQMAGSVSLFAWDESSKAYNSVTKLSPFVSARGASFGQSVALVGDMVIVGAPGDNRGAGTLYTFESDGHGSFANVTKSNSTSVSGRAAYGSAMAGTANIAVIGATGMDSRSGGAVVWEAGSDGSWVDAGVVINQAKGFEAITEGEARCENSKVADFECSNVDIVSFLPLSAIGASRGSAVNDMWGWSDSQTGKEYAIVGRTDGTSFVDVTNPAAPIYLANLPMTPGANPAIWRDMKVYKDHAYIVADASGQHGMQVFDLARLRVLDGSNPPTVKADVTYDKIASAHNIVINEDTGFAYSVGSSSGGETCGGGLHMIDIRQPKNPTFAGCFGHEGTGRTGTGYSHDAQCVIYSGPDSEHVGKEICLGSNETALSISDVTDKKNPKAISMVVYPNVAYAHQGWLSEDQEYFYMNDEGDEGSGLVAGTRTLVWDLSDLDEPILAKEYIATTKATDHNLYIKDNLMYQSNYDAGLRIIDISDRANPVEVGFLDTTPNGGMGSWSNYPYFKSGAIGVTSGGEGLFMIRKQDQGL
ncbi:MAG: choice-of-anchor B family protein [Bacteroidetes bacterium]|nr:choice-of-anchor B family protein [Bacteroidota bacterium]